MKRLVLLAWFLVLGALAAREEPRVFTNKEGRTVQATPVAVDGTDAVLRLKNRKIAKVPLESLSDDDQAFMRRWWEENKNKLDPMDFVLEIDRKHDALDRNLSRSGGGGGGNRNNNRSQVTKRDRSDEYIYKCELKNYLPRDLDDIQIEYTIYKKVSKHDEQGSDNYTEEIDGSTTIRRLAALGTEEFETDAVICEDSSQTGGNGPRLWHRESIRGVVFTLSYGGREFLRQSDPEGLLEQLEREEDR